MRRLILIALLFLILGCNNDHHWKNLSETFGASSSEKRRSAPTTIEVSEFGNSRLRISGSCGLEKEIMLILPATAKDQRIIGSPRCKDGKYYFSTSSFGRPPCGVIVEYGGSKSVTASVKGTSMYCN